MRSFLRTLGRVLLNTLFLLVSELRDQAYLVLVIAVGAGLIVQVLLPGAEWGAGMVVFAGLSLVLRRREGDGGNRRPE